MGFGREAPLGSMQSGAERNQRDNGNEFGKNYEERVTWAAQGQHPGTGARREGESIRGEGANRQAVEKACDPGWLPGS